MVSTELHCLLCVLIKHDSMEYYYKDDVDNHYAPYAGGFSTGTVASLLGETTELD